MKSSPSPPQKNKKNRYVYQVMSVSMSSSRLPSLPPPPPTHDELLQVRPLMSKKVFFRPNGLNIANTHVDGQVVFEEVALGHVVEGHDGAVAEEAHRGQQPKHGLEEGGFLGGGGDEGWILG